MRLTTYTDYALRVLMYIALRPERLVRIADISSAYRISEPHLIKVVHQLGIAGYIETIRGRGGGIRLARPASAIVVGEVVRRMEPEFGLVACFREGERCAIEHCCVLSRAFEDALGAFLRVLDEYTLGDLVDRRGQLLGILRVKEASRVRP